MFISFDNGAHWQSFQLNLPRTPITDIKVYQKDLIVSTQGRAIWILDNISGAAAARRRTATPTTVASLQAARRLSHAREPESARPDDRVLPAGRRRRARSMIDILDAKGARRELATTATRRRRRGGGGAADAAAARGGAGAALRRCGAPAARSRSRRRRRRRRPAAAASTPRVTKDAGINRVRVGRAASDAASALPPGAYQARLTVDGETLDAAVHGADRSALAAEGLTAADLSGAVRSQHADARAAARTSTQIVTRVRDARDAAAERDRRRRRQGEAVEAIYEQAR